MFINEKKNAIELSKKEAKAAAKFGTPEYKALQEARRDYPTFSVKTVSQKPAAKKNTFKGLTYEYMEMYIESWSLENATMSVSSSDFILGIRMRVSLFTHSLL